MRQLKVAIIGQGRSGHGIHGAHILKDNRFKVVAVVDPIEVRREIAKKDFEGCDVYETYQELFGRTDIDLVVNATPSQFHHSVAIDLMRNGFNVLQEKPIAANSKQVHELEQVINETGRIFAIFLQSRYAPQFIKVREITESGVLGRLVCVKITANCYARRWDWQTLHENVAGSLYNTGPHPLGQALEFLNYYDGVPEVVCKMDRVNTFGDAEDYVKLILAAPKRPLIDIEISNCDAYPAYTYHIQGDRGTLIANKEGIKWKYFKLEEAPEQHLVSTPLIGKDNKPKYCSEKLIWHEKAIDYANIIDNVFSNATNQLYTDVYECIVNGKELPVSFKQVAQQISIMDIAYNQTVFD